VLRESPHRIVGGVMSCPEEPARRTRGRPVCRGHESARDRAPAPGLVSRGLVVIETAAAADPDAYVARSTDGVREHEPRVERRDRREGRVPAAQEGTREVMTLGPGIHVLCNDRMGADGFPRGDRLVSALERWLAQAREASGDVAGRVFYRDLLEVLPGLLGDHTRTELAATPPSRFPPSSRAS